MYPVINEQIVVNQRLPLARKEVLDWNKGHMLLKPVPLLDDCLRLCSRNDNYIISVMQLLHFPDNMLVEQFKLLKQTGPPVEDFLSAIR